MKFLMCYDYGMGGFWWRVEAPTAAAVRTVFPDFIVFDSPPEWWVDGRRLPHVHEYTLGDPMDEYTRKLVAEAARHANGSS
jgi:hypothetical protein